MNLKNPCHIHLVKKFSVSIKSHLTRLSLYYPAAPHAATHPSKSWCPKCSTNCFHCTNICPYIMRPLPYTVIKM